MMLVTDPGRGKLKPHLRKLRSGTWAVFYRDKDGHLFGVTQVSFMTSHSNAAHSARLWADSHNLHFFRNRNHK